MTPKVGHFVSYTLSAEDADAINKSRKGAPGDAGEKVSAGETYRARVGSVTAGKDPKADLRVIIGDDSYPVTARGEGTGNGAWKYDEDAESPAADGSPDSGTVADERKDGLFPARRDLRPTRWPAPRPSGPETLQPRHDVEFAGAPGRDGPGPDAEAGKPKEAEAARDAKPAAKEPSKS